MHTFSPAKMWIAGLSEYRKPLLHLHTQFNRDIPWDTIDMDFMNLNQAAHGDREYGFIGARMGIARKVIVGYWEDPAVLERIGGWMRTAMGFIEGRNLKVARFGDNMRHVAVTEGVKVEAQIKFGCLETVAVLA
jgi:L-arabinose isomerase